MSITEAFKELINSEAFKEIAKQRDSLGGKYRLYISRFNRRELKVGAMVEVLLDNGYEVKANKVKRKIR